MEINPYEVLEVEKDATPLAIKKAYKRLSLKFHPDKIQQQNLDHDNTFFPKIQFAYSILSDPAKRNRYDTTGSLGLSGEDPDDVFDWKDYFDSMTEKITIDMIEEDRAKYQGSEEEREDILHNFVYYEGDFLRLFEVIPHLEFDEAQESRVFDLLEDAIVKGELSMDHSMEKTWDKYKKSRKTKVKAMLKKLAREAKQAEKMAKKITKKPIKTEGDLAALIQKKNAGSLDNLISSLESKYGKSKGKKREAPVIDDEEFERIQRSMKKKK
ncbi:hypothetical protein ACI3LY_004878 [Candidozyma auris]|uniref:J domain-containing protein n=2 Tax=Candidozyma auris TaxID=498019 RepID=A0AB36W9U0_CANAR|nr:hypothetical protein QG37_06170 [[Candida] auris]PIS54740.1 hypothetical protein B9J08_002520 [[Candida] auris]PIS55366.1 hypothetical protein CJI97_002065 [[Candida] auris]QWW25742.1 hypothetical protein CA7LBN_004646 [[Candida] auris]